jgi:lysophospholipase L1-like esterase
VGGGAVTAGTTSATTGFGGAGGSATTSESSSAGGSNGGGANEPVTVFIAGDSTVSTYPDTASPDDQAGWGQMLGALFDDRVTVDNRAIGGRTARRFIEEGRLDEISDGLQAGDFLLVQFGTNDSNTTATYELDGQTIPYYLDPDTDFKSYLMQYVQLGRDREATTVLVTPPPRNSAYCTGGNGTGAYAEAMRELGMAEDVPVSDLNAKTVTHLMAICPAPTPEDFFLVRSDGSVDGTHFQENGARILAGFVAEGIAEAGLSLAEHAR